MGIDGNDAIAIGAPPYDAEAAGNAKARTIGILCGGFTEHWLRQAGCTGSIAESCRRWRAKKILLCFEPKMSSDPISTSAGTEYTTPSHAMLLIIRGYSDVQT